MAESGVTKYRVTSDVLMASLRAMRRALTTIVQ